MKNLFVLLCFLFLFKTAFSQNLESNSVVFSISCYGDCNGEIVINATGGNPPYEYALDNMLSFQASNIFSGLCSGNYDTQVRDSQGVTIASSVIILEPVPLVFSGFIISSTTSGASGVIEAITTGGISPYSYSIDNGVFQAVNIFSDLSAGNYNIMVRDSNGCMFYNIITIDEISSVDNGLLVNVDQLTANADADTYQWIDAETQSIINGATNKTYKTGRLGKFRVEMTMTMPDVIGKSSNTKQVIRFSSSTYEVTSLLGVNDNTSNVLKIYPNPANNYLILPKASINKDYKIYTVLGGELNSGKIINEAFSIEKLLNGIYYLNIEGFNTFKFIKQ